MKFRVLGFLGVVVLLAGCATSSMKGTPFYTGEYEESEGAAADRVNVWPILYYRDPALSVLWPFMEFAPDVLAVRPFYSIYDRDTETPVYNVVWPIGKFDTKKDENRIFPVYWGDDYFNVFPLYWHEGDPISGTGHNSLFPFWIWNHKASGTSLHIFWPLYAKTDYAEYQGWRLWPIYGNKDYLYGYERFWAWPLGWAYEKPGDKGHGFVPFYMSKTEDQRKTFVTLPYSRSLSTKPQEKSWDLTLPLWYRGWEGTTNQWAAISLISWGENAAEFSDNWYAAGLAHSAKGDDFRAHHILPFYYHNRDADSSCFYSLPWWSKDHASGAGWSATFPFYYGSYSPEGKIVVTPLYARKKHADGTQAWSCYIPIVYFDRTKDSHFMTLLGGAWYMGDEHRWLALPLLSGGKSNADSGKTVWAAGLAGRKWNAEEHSHYVFPFYSYAPQQKKFSSVFYSSWPDGTAQRSMIPILLSGQKVEDDYALKFLVAGLVLKEKKGDELLTSQVIPFYSWHKDHDFYTALWGHDQRMKYYCTPLIGSYANENSGSWVYPLYRHKTTEEGNVDGRYLLLGSYGHDEDERYHKFWGIYKFRDWQRFRWKDDDKAREESSHLDYLLIGKSHEDRRYGDADAPEVVTGYKKSQRLFPVWSHSEKADLQRNVSEESSAWLWFLYDTRKEEQNVEGEEPHNYVRRRVLWRLWHYEKLNGNSTTDMFPGITIDSYKNGYKKSSFLWRLFRYENDPETGEKNVDLLFIPLKRSKAE